MRADRVENVREGQDTDEFDALDHRRRADASQAHEPKAVSDT